QLGRVVDVTEDPREPRRLPGAGPRALDAADVRAGLGQVPGRGEPDDAAADHDDVGRAVPAAARPGRAHPRRARSSMTLARSFSSFWSPLTRPGPLACARIHWGRWAFSASTLKSGRPTETVPLASPAGSRATFGPGTSTRQTATSERDLSSRRRTSASFARAGTSATNRVTAPSISCFVSAVATAGGWSARGGAVGALAGARAPRRAPRPPPP